MNKIFLLTASVLGFIAVALGAFSAHALQNILTAKMLSVFQTAVTYQFYHALALFMVGLLQTQFDTVRLTLVGMFFISGVVLFSGSLYVLALTGVKTFAIVTPFGGVCFLLGWMTLAWRIYKGIK